MRMEGVFRQVLGASSVSNDDSKIMQELIDDRQEGMQITTRLVWN